MTEDERAAKRKAMMFFQRLGGAFKSVTIDGIKISMVGGTLRTDSQIEQMKADALAKEKARQEDIINTAFGGLEIGGMGKALKGVSSIELEGVDGEFVFEVSGDDDWDFVQQGVNG